MKSEIYLGPLREMGTPLSVSVFKLLVRGAYQLYRGRRNQRMHNKRLKTSDGLITGIAAALAYFPRKMVDGNGRPAADKENQCSGVGLIESYATCKRALMSIVRLKPSEIPRDCAI